MHTWGHAQIDRKLLFSEFLSTLETRCDESSFWNHLKFAYFSNYIIWNTNMQKFTVIEYWMCMQRPLKVCTCERWEFWSFEISNKFCLPTNEYEVAYPVSDRQICFPKHKKSLLRVLSFNEYNNRQGVRGGTLHSKPLAYLVGLSLTVTVT